MDETQKLNSVEVIHQAMKSQIEAGLDFEHFLKQLATLLKKPNHKLIQLNNTVFLLHKVSNSTCDVKILTIDNPQTIIESFKALMDVLKKSGIKKIRGYSESQGFVDMANQSGIPFKLGHSRKMINGKETPVFTFEAEI